MPEGNFVQIYIGLGMILVSVVLYFVALRPKLQLEKYLRDSKNWETSEGGMLHTYKPKPKYRVFLRKTGDYTPGEWADALGETSKKTEFYLVEVWVGKKIPQLHEFISFDDGKYFILNPTTKSDFIVQELPFLYYSSQLPIIALLGKYGEDVEAFCERAGIEII